MPSPNDAIIAKERKALMDLMDTGPFKVPSRKINENLLIASWNIRRLSHNKSRRALSLRAFRYRRIAGSEDRPVRLEQITGAVTRRLQNSRLRPDRQLRAVCLSCTTSDRCTQPGWSARSASTCQRRPIRAISYTGCLITRRFRAGCFDFEMATAHLR